ncbi:hypothetical protein SCHPADRAFT_479573 [Schizopora paradoxa]|uniref:Uncharacterized protein n=1 Tax=Schizopora paradoxa TaxID=27342 RepID=A0A0H2RI24_9AGAM|nr:hypothetical protein SCHPADRAFT_479573 [Schizopora paradoxa]
MEKSMEAGLRMKERQLVETEWIRVNIKDVPGFRRRSSIPPENPTMQQYVNTSRLPRSRDTNRRDSGGSFTPLYSAKYPPIHLAELIREQAASRYTLSGLLSAHEDTVFDSELYPMPLYDQYVNDLCLGLVEHLKSESKDTFLDALESILDLTAAYPYLRTLFQNTGAGPALNYQTRKGKALDERTHFLLAQAFKAVYPSGLHGTSSRIHYFHTSQGNFDDPNFRKNLQKLLHRCQTLDTTPESAALGARYLRYIILDQRQMKTSLWRGVKRTPDAASRAIMDLLDYELANLVPCVRSGDVFANELDALFEATLSLMQIQLTLTHDVPTSLVEAVLRRNDLHSLFPKSAPLALSIRKRLRSINPQRLMKRHKSLQSGFGHRHRGLDHGDTQCRLHPAPRDESYCLVISEPSYEYDDPHNRRWMPDRDRYTEFATPPSLVIRILPTHDTPIRSRTL